MIDDESLRNLEKLHKLKEEGVITAEDFDAAKERLLKGQPKRPQALPMTMRAAGTGLPAEEDYLGWALLPLKRYAQFDGRSTRKEFWMFLLAINVVFAALLTIALTDTDYLGQLGMLGKVAVLVLVIGVLGAFVPYIALLVRRFHDQNKSGWFAAINLIPYLGALIVLGFMLVQGDTGDNDYGPDPRA
ncbi:DUF805 domain-containing protein [Tsuneonella flava]|uniref:DUF805 domain-containing protein n=1 Tax=Tsuneonella flava TaxID=2055955 RepID=A0ABX7KCX0_9SPHN|nr:DUF805 domain-containing protein [Tsuneonella flava]QSB44350.1 DUF805 domain-containing protein [Tsuneonella flava]